MAEPRPEGPPPAALEAAIAALPAKKEASREAFDRLTGCFPYPLPFTSEDLDAHVSGIQSSVSRRFRQVQLPEAARQARAVPASAETRSVENQEEEEPSAVAKKDKAAQEEETGERRAYAEPGSKNSMVCLRAKMTRKQIRRAPSCGSKDLTAVCASMDAHTLVKFITCISNAHAQALPIAVRHAPDAAALALRVVKLFLSSKTFKATKVWNKCIRLIRCVPAADSKPSADTVEQAKQVAKDWKEMVDKLESPGDLDSLAVWGLLHFLVSYGSMVPRHKMKNAIQLCQGLGIADRITDLIDYLIGKGQQLEVYHLANVFNLSDKYPLLSLLKGYIETAKHSSMEIQSKSLISAIPKEIQNLWVAHHLAKQKITDRSQGNAIMAEIKKLLDGYARMKKHLAKASTSNSQPQQKQNKKKRKKEEQELHKGQESLQKGEQCKVREQEHGENNRQHKQQKQESQTRKNEQLQQKIWPQEMHRPRPCTPKLPTPAVPLVLNVAQIGQFGHPPYAAMHGVPSYSIQPGWPGVGGAPPCTPPLGAAQYIRSFNPFYPHHPQFFPR